MYIVDCQTTFPSCFCAAARAQKNLNIVIYRKIRIFTQNRWIKSFKVQNKSIKAWVFMIVSTCCFTYRHHFSLLFDSVRFRSQEHLGKSCLLAFLLVYRMCMMFSIKHNTNALYFLFLFFIISFFSFNLFMFLSPNNKHSSSCM